VVALDPDKVTSDHVTEHMIDIVTNVQDVPQLHDVVALDPDEVTVEELCDEDSRFILIGSLRVHFKIAYPKVPPRLNKKKEKSTPRLTFQHLRKKKTSCKKILVVR
jgi:hypothetical protein